MRYRRTDGLKLIIEKLRFEKPKKNEDYNFLWERSQRLCLQKETLRTSVSPIFAAVLVSSVLSPSRCNFVGLKQTNNLDTSYNNYIVYLKCSEKT